MYEVITKHVPVSVIREANNPYVTVPPAEEIHTNILFLKTDPSRLTGDDLLSHLQTVSGMVVK